MASSLFLPEISGLFLSGWNLRVSSMHLLLTCVSDTSSFRENPKMPRESLRFIPTLSGSYSLLFRRGGEGGKLFWLPCCCWLFLRGGGVFGCELEGFDDGSGFF